MTLYFGGKVSHHSTLIDTSRPGSYHLPRSLAQCDVLKIGLLIELATGQPKSAVVDRQPSDQGASPALRKAWNWRADVRLRGLRWHFDSIIR